MPSGLAVNSRWERLPSESDGLSMFVAEPEGPGPFAGIVCFHTMAGVNTNLQETAQRIASYGCVVVAPNLFHRATKATEFRMPEERERAESAFASTDFYSVAADSREALNFLRASPTVDPDRLGTIGYCIGGTWSFLAACFNRDVRAAVVAYGTGIVSGPKTPGKPIEPIALADRIQGPMLWLSGSADQFIPRADVEAMGERMDRLGKQCDLRVYNGEPAAGHAFFSADQPRFYNEGAASWGWKIKLDFIQRHLIIHA